jgi:hypothetical protein
MTRYLQIVMKTARTTACLSVYLEQRAPHQHHRPLLWNTSDEASNCQKVSTEKQDFIYIDRSVEARESVSLRGIGGEQSVIGRRGAMVIATQDENGTILYMIDPAGVYLDETSSSNLRILGQQRMKNFGFDLVQNKNGDGQDFLVHRSRQNDFQSATNLPFVKDKKERDLKRVLLPLDR